MKCEKCKKEIESSFTSNDNKSVCKECLEQEIYNQRKRIKKKYKNKELR